MYYERDPAFYLYVLEQEEPGQYGHDFKMHIFKDQSEVEFDQKFELEIASKLADFDAGNLKIGKISPFLFIIHFSTDWTKRLSCKG